MSFKLLKKVISIFTLIAFLATNVVYAAPSSKSLFKNKKVDYNKLSNERQDSLEKKQSVVKDEDAKEVQSQRKEAKKILSSHLEDISQIHIPQDLGRIVEVYNNATSIDKKPNLIVHIQDLHTNPEAELNLAKILELLLKDYNMDLVLSEGAVGKVDTSSVSSFPDQAIREKVSRIFINSGELTGEEYLSITKYPDLPIWGIETKDIYFRNIIDFNKIMKFNPTSQTFISQTKKAIEELKPKVYSKELLDLDSKEIEYENSKLDTAKYIQYLTSFTKSLNISMSNYKNISLLIETMEKEKAIDQLKIMSQSQNLLLNLQSIFSSKALNNDSDTLMARASLFKDQKISPFSFYSYLKDLSLKHLKEDFAIKYQALNSFIDYLTKVNSLDSTKLFTELENLNYEIKEELSKTDEQKTLVKADHNINFLENFFNLKVSNEDLDYYLNNKNSHKVAFFKDSLTKTLKRYNINAFIDYNPDLIDNHLHDLEDFYKVVKERDIAMVTNSILEIEKRNSKVSTLIAGGFHTKGITKLLKEKGYSYIVVSPYSKTDIDEENYHFLLSGRRKPITELLKQLDLSKIVTKASKTLRVPLAFDSALLAGFNAQVAPEIARIWDLSTDEVTLLGIANRIGVVLAVEAGGDLAKLAKWKNPLAEMAARVTTQDAIILKLTPRDEEPEYFRITKDRVEAATEADFKAGKAIAAAESAESEVMGDASKELPASARITALAHEIFADPDKTLAATAFQYGLTRGDTRLIELLSTLLKRENIDAHPDTEVVILNSISEAEDTLARLLIEEGDTIICQKGSLSRQDKKIYNFYGAKFAKLNLSNIEDVEKLGKLLETKFIHLPSVKFIQVLSEREDGREAISNDARVKLLELAERYKLLLIEDGRYREPVLSKKGSLKAMDKKGLDSRVVQLRSLSPLFGKDVDIGSIYVVLPSALAVKFEATKGSVTLHPNSMAQVFVYKELLRRYDPQEVEFRQLTKEEKEPELPRWLTDILSDYGKKVKLSEIRRILKLMADPELISLAGGIPAKELFPYKETDELIAEFGEREWKEALTRSPSQGIDRLRNIIAKNHYSRPEDVIITDGSQQGLDLLGYLVKTIAARGTDRSMEIITQTPTYLGLMSAVEPYGCVVKPYDLNSLEGLEKLRRDLIERKSSGKALPSLIYAMSTFDNPGGRVMSLEVRKMLLNIAIEFDIFIAEDNPYGALRYEGDEIPTLFELSKDLDEDMVIYLGTVSKTFTPGMRIGWTIAPREIIDILKMHEEMTRGGANSLTQVLTTQFIETGLIDTHVKNVLIAEYSKRRAAMIAALAKYMPKGVTWTKGQGGYFIFLTLPEEVNAEELLVEMTTKGRNGKKVGFVPGWAFLGGPNQLRLSFPTNPPEVIDTAINALAIAIKDKLAEDRSGTFTTASIEDLQRDFGGKMGTIQDDSVKQALSERLLDLIEPVSLAKMDQNKTNIAALNLLNELVASDEAMIVFVAAKMLKASPEIIEGFKPILVYWHQTLVEQNKQNEYAVEIIRSAIKDSKSWEPFIASVAGDLQKGLEVLRRNKEIFLLADEGKPGYASTIIRGEDLKDVPDDKKIDITQLDPATRAEIMKPREHTHHLTPEGPAVEAVLLGGAGKRHQEALVEEPEFAKMLKIMLGEMGRFIDQFKAALPAGNVPILRLKLGRGREVRQTVVFMAAQDNAGQAEEFANAVIQGSLNADEKPKLVSFIQPITPRRVPTRKALEEFFSKEGRPEDADVMLANCDKHAGEVALDDNGKPIFGPENHWDFIKYFIQDGLFLELFEEALTNEELHDVILRVTNQDNSGSSVGENRPAQAAVNSLIDRLQTDDGLYAFLDELDAKSDTEWKTYKSSPEYRARLHSVIAAVIEGGLTPTYTKTGGGVFSMLQGGKLTIIVDETTVVAERANIRGETPPTNITNSNTIGYSLLALSAMCGLRPKDVETMLKTKRETGHISAEQRAILVQGVQAAEASYVPIRQQVKINRTPSRRGIPVQGPERDYHGPLGRAFDALLFIGESMQTYRHKMSQMDRQLLERKISFSDHQKAENLIAGDLTFVPNKEFKDWREGRRPGLALAKFLGYRDESPVRSPDDILAGLKDKTPEAFLKALQEEGYYFSEQDLPLIEAFLTRNERDNVVVQGRVVLKKGPADTNWWEQAMMAELAKNPTPWGEDAIVPVEREQGVLKVTLTAKMFEDWSPDNPEGRDLDISTDKYDAIGPLAIAGIRHVMNISNVHDTRQVKNSVERLLTTVALGLMIKMKYNKGAGFPFLTNYGHEVRYNSQVFQDITTRALAAMGFICNVVPGNVPVAIWDTSTMGKMFDMPLSFCGTASHSPSSVDGLKIMDYEGSQFLISDIQALIKIKQAIVQHIKEKGSFTITLAAEDDPRVTDQLYESTRNGMAVYKEYQEKTAADELILGLIRTLDPSKVHIDCMYGSGYRTLKAFFKEMGLEAITDRIDWMHTEEKPDFGNIGKVQEDPRTGKAKLFDLGADGAQMMERVMPDGSIVKYFPVLCTADYPEKLAKMPIGDIILPTDMDNDRLFYIQIMPNDEATKKLLDETGVVYNVINAEKIAAVHIPNKSFHLLQDMNLERIVSLMRQGKMSKDRAIVILKTLASTPAVDQWAEKKAMELEKEGIKIRVINTAVGFAKLANIMYKTEGAMRGQPGEDVIISDATGKDINIGTDPLILAAWEESGGIIVGTTEKITDLLGNSFLAMREKSATESIFLSLALISKLQKEKGAVDFATYLKEIYADTGVTTPIDLRYENALYVPAATKESALEEIAGNERKNRIFGAYLSIVIAKMRGQLSVEEAKKILKDMFDQEYDARKAQAQLAPVLTERFSKVDFDFLKDIWFTGDGVMFVFEKEGKQWFELFRPSGTEPKLKSYGFGEDVENLTIYAWSFGFNENIAGKLPESFTSNSILMELWGADGIKAVDKGRRMQQAWEDFGLVIDPQDLGQEELEQLETRRLVRTYTPPDNHLELVNRWLKERGLPELNIDFSKPRAMPQEAIAELLEAVPESVYETLGHTKEEVLKNEQAVLGRGSVWGLLRTMARLGIKAGDKITVLGIKEARLKGDGEDTWSESSVRREFADALNLLGLLKPTGTKDKGREEYEVITALTAEQLDALEQNGSVKTMLDKGRIKKEEVREIKNAMYEVAINNAAKDAVLIAKEFAGIVKATGLQSSQLIEILLNATNIQTLVNRLAILSGKNSKDVLEILSGQPLLRSLVNRYRLEQIAASDLPLVIPSERQASLKSKDLIDADKAHSYSEHGVAVSVSLPGDEVIVDKDELNVVQAFYGQVQDIMQRKEDQPEEKRANLNYRREVVKYYNNEFTAVAAQLDEYVAEHFGSIEKVDYLFVMGMGANEFLLHEMMRLQEELRQAGTLGKRPKFILVNNPVELERILAEYPDIRDDNSLWMYLSRSGETTETEKILGFTHKKFTHNIAFANQGALKILGERFAETGTKVFPFSPKRNMGGRFMRRKTEMVYAPVYLAFGPEITRKYVEVTDAADTKLSFTKKDGFAFQLARFIDTTMRLGRRKNIAMVIGSERLMPKAKELRQWVMEGVNKPEALSPTLLSIYTPGDEPLHRATENMADDHIAIVLLDKSDTGYTEASRKAELLKQRMPVIVIEVEKMTIEASAELTTLFEDVIASYSHMVNQDHYSNPMVRAVRNEGAVHLARLGEEAREKLGIKLEAGALPVAKGRPDEETVISAEEEIGPDDATISLWNQVSILAVELGIDYNKVLEMLFTEAIDAVKFCGDAAENARMLRSVNMARKIQNLPNFKKLTPRYENAVSSQAKAAKADVFVQADVLTAAAKKLGIDIEVLLGEARYGNTAVQQRKDQFNALLSPIIKRAEDEGDQKTLLAIQLATFLALARAEDPARHNISFFVNNSSLKQLTKAFKDRISGIMGGLVFTGELPTDSHSFVEGIIGQSRWFVNILVVARDYEHPDGHALGYLLQAEDVHTPHHVGLAVADVNYGLAIGNADGISAKSPTLVITIDKLTGDTRKELEALFEKVGQIYNQLLTKTMEPTQAQSSTRQQAKDMDQIIAVQAEAVKANTEGFEKWVGTLPTDNVVVIIAMDEGEYASVKEYKGYQDRVYIKTLADLKVDRLDLVELFGTYGTSGNFGGFKLGTTATIEKYKSVAGAIAQGV